MGYAWAHTIEATANAAIPLNVDLPGASDSEPDFRIHDGFSSLHPGGGLFLFLDGSVRYIDDGISIGVYRALATIQGDEPINEL